MAKVSVILPALVAAFREFCWYLEKRLGFENLGYSFSNENAKFQFPPEFHVLRSFFLAQCPLRVSIRYLEHVPFDHKIRAQKSTLSLPKLFSYILKLSSIPPFYYIPFIPQTLQKFPRQSNIPRKRSLTIRPECRRRFANTVPDRRHGFASFNTHGVPGSSSRPEIPRLWSEKIAGVSRVQGMAGERLSTGRMERSVARSHAASNLWCKRFWWVSLDPVARHTLTVAAREFSRQKPVDNGPSGYQARSRWRGT